MAKRQGRSKDQSEDFRQNKQNKQHSWLSPICIGQAQVEEKTYNRRSQSAFSRTLSPACVCSSDLQHAVPVHQRYKTTADHGKYHTHLDTAIRTLRIETSKRGRPNTPHRPSSAGSSQKDLDAPIPKELGLPSLEGGMLGR